MSCYGCGSGFGAFKKEHGCKNCGFAFCTKCLTNKHEIAKMNNEKHKVCNKCYNILTGKIKPKEDKAKYSPPENYKKRMAALQEREAAVVHAGGSTGTGGRGGNHIKAQHKGMSKADLEIQQRLDKLKEKTAKEVAASNVSNKEIDERLAKLKGMDPARYNTSDKPTYRPPDRRTQQEEMNDLLDEIANEVELDAQLPDPAQEIAARLARLKDKDGQEKQNNASPESDENNLNKPSMRDSQTFSQNIGSDKSSTDTQDTAPESSSTNSEIKPQNITLKIPSLNSEKKHQNITPPKYSSNTENKTSNTAADEQISAEDVTRILNEASYELEVDAQRALEGLQQDKEIMKRLQQVKQRRKESNTDINKDDNIDNSDSENEEVDDNQLAENIIKQAIEESKLDEAAAKDGIASAVNVDRPNKKKTNIGVKPNDDSDEWDDPDELPYCCICTEDAAVRCFGCDRDLYCSKCFSDGHKELGLTDHASIKYEPPKQKT